MLGVYRLALDAILKLFKADTVQLLDAVLDRPEVDLDVIAPFVAQRIRQAREEAYGRAVDLLVESALEQGVVNPYIPKLPGYSEASVKRVLEELMREDRRATAVRATVRFASHVEDAARQTVVRAVQDGTEVIEGDSSRSFFALEPEEFEEKEDTGVQPLAWARVLSGPENCAFCIVLASRGPVYSDAEMAGRKRADTLEENYINSYHDGCDCMVVPVFSMGDWAGRDAWRELEKFYKQALKDVDKSRLYERRKEYKGKPEKNDLLAAVDQAVRDGKRPNVENIRESTSIGSGNEKPDRYISVEKPVEKRRHDGLTVTPAEDATALGGAEDLYGNQLPFKDVRRARERTKESRDYWEARQDALGIPKNGNEAKPHEIETVERLFELGDPPIEWLPLGEFLPNSTTERRAASDILWHGKKFEIKRAKTPKFGHIRDNIAPYVERAKKSRVNKEYFLIDIGRARLSPHLVNSLEQYNRRNPENLIKELWILDHDGIHQIPLK